MCYGKAPLTSPTWGINLDEFQRRFDPDTSDGQGPQRLKNLYFTYLVELRALAKAAPYLAKVRLSSIHAFTVLSVQFS